MVKRSYRRFMVLAALFYCLALFIHSQAFGAGPRRAPEPIELSLTGVELEHLLVFELPPRVEFPQLRIYPGHLAAEVFLPLDVAQVERVLSSLPKTYETRLTPLESGTRLVLFHPSRRMIFSSGTTPKHSRTNPPFALRLGYESEEGRLRRLADFVRQPLPYPEGLGAQLELWQEAEKETLGNNVQGAMRLWEKLAEQPALRDLAEVRISSLFIITGHINEALRRLRAVSRQYPRSSGATLARVLAVHLESIIGESQPSAEQIMIAGRSGNRPRLRPFIDLAVAYTLLEANFPTAAILTCPPPDQLTGDWRKYSETLAHDAVSQAVLGANLRKGPYHALVQFLAWQPRFAHDPDLQLFLRTGSDAFMKLGLYEPAIPVLRQQIAAFPESGEEARLVIDLAQAYLELDENDHLKEVIRFLVRHHPDAPGAIDVLRQLALNSAAVDSLAPTLATLASLRNMSPSRTLSQKLFSIELDLVAAFGTPAQTVQSLLAMREVGFDDPEIREPQLAIAMARDGQAASAEPRLRRWLNKATNPETRDEMAYLLAQAEDSLNRPNEARKIVAELAENGTRWGLVARARLREQALTEVVDALVRARQAIAAKSRPPATSPENTP